MVADFLIRLPSDGGGINYTSVLAELKVISCCPTRYARAPRHKEKAVQRWAKLLPGEYARKAKKMDTEYGGVPNGEEGPVAKKLASFPLQSWVFGAFGEASEDIHSLVYSLAKARLRHEEMLEGGGMMRRRGIKEGAALSLITGQVRRGISIVTAQAQARCLLERVEVLGGGGKEASRRRRWAEEEERRSRRENHAHTLSMMHGRSVLRRGDIYLQ